MPVIRGPNTPGSSGDQTRQVGSSPDPYADKTVAVGRGDTKRTVAPSATRVESTDERTRIVGARKSSTSATVRDFLDDPVVGWLVIVKGPGKGQSLKVGYGQNAIGRAPGQRIQIDYGDDQISREEHAFITYDPKGRKFYVQIGGSSNLIYIGSSPVLAPTELTANTELTLGSTTLRFVPFCGSSFDWQGDDLSP